MKILIIKTGYSETFTELASTETCSLGDVLRTTFILNFFKSEEVDWLSSKLAFPLLNTKNISKRLDIKDDSVDFSQYQLIINLEKDEDILSKVKVVKNLIGFFKKEDELMLKLSNGEELTFISFLQSYDHENTIFQRKVCRLLGKDWAGEEYLLERKHPLEEDKIGLNWKVGSKWPSKQIPEEFWKEVETDLKEKSHMVSWQKGFEDLEKYISWIDSCKTIITSDSLGLHLAVALKKNIIALFGPTNSSHIELYDRGIKISYMQEDFPRLKSSIMEVVKKK